ncbi:MAG: endonuclease MutS2 [Eubacteriales bacterium]|nr:endonuclease MutS2 [Eubacteriales bacterium]
MNERALRVLEFTKIREMLAGYALSEFGRQKCLALTPLSDFAEVNRALDETEEAVVALTFLGGHPMTPFDDISEYLALAGKGSTLSQKALLSVAETLRSARAARSALVTDRENTPIITAMASRLQPMRQLEEDITEAILSEDEISDHASPALLDIRRHIRSANDRIREKLNSMAHGAAYSKYLMESIVTVRDGRYVLPVKQEYRQNVPGLVHDQSATGATLFIEPMAVVEMGNELKEWHMKERAEIERILAALSAQVADGGDLIAQNLSILQHLDFAFAKGMLSRELECVRPKMNEAGKINLVRVRHPLINREKVVPCSLWLGDDFTSLIITGPNTGGKTVTLKTLGLMTLMAQSGLHVPGALGTELSTFEEVYADIGDEQSIEQSLSTFSSHMTNIVGIMNAVTPRDLVLFDELGAGTDPTEGAALAQVILDALLKIHVRTAATTHYSELKAYALSTKGVENASVEFDVATLRPTYRLSIGVPGKSNAFEISRRLGLPEYLIDNAKQLLSHDTIRFEDVIANAEYHRQVAEKERQLAEQARQETVQLRNEAERLYKDMEEKREASTRKAKEEARRIMEKAKRESESILYDLKRMKKSANVPEHEVNALKKRMEDGIDSLSEGLSKPTGSFAQPPKTVKIGDIVEITNLNTKGTVLSLPDAKGEVQLQAGILKLKAHLSQLRLVQEKPKAKPVSSVRVNTGAMERTVHMSCDVRGMALDEAMAEVDQYLDEAVLAGLNEVTIVHGKGTGILREGLQRYLKTNGHVKSFRRGVYGEGEDGVTIVQLK